MHPNNMNYTQKKQAIKTIIALERKLWKTKDVPEKMMKMLP